jgi:hypothetical protein
MAKRDAASGARHALYITGSGSQAIFLLDGLTTNVFVLSTEAISAGNWYHMCGVYDSVNSLLKVWVNGVKTEVAASGSATDSDGDFSIGREGAADSEYFDGIIDDVAVFNRALTDAEVTGIYNGLLYSKYLSIANASCANLEIAGSQTWSAWIKPETDSLTENVVTKYAVGGSYHKRILKHSLNDFRFQLDGLTTASFVISTVAVSAGNWYHVCGVYDSANTKLKIFVNGTKTEVTASGSATDTDGGFAIGADGAVASTLFDGIIDDVAVFDRALTDVEVGRLYALHPRSFGAILA